MTLSGRAVTDSRSKKTLSKTEIDSRKQNQYEFVSVDQYKRQLRFSNDSSAVIARNGDSDSMYTKDSRVANDPELGSALVKSASKAKLETELLKVTFEDDEYDPYKQEGSVLM
jgi:hypothetical protein